MKNFSELRTLNESKIVEKKDSPKEFEKKVVQTVSIMKKYAANKGKSDDVLRKGAIKYLTQKPRGASDDWDEETMYEASEAWVLVQNRKIIKKFKTKPSNSAFTSSDNQTLMTVSKAAKMGIKESVDEAALTDKEMRDGDIRARQRKSAIKWKVKPPKGQKNIHPDSKWPGMKPGDIEKMNESVELDELCEAQGKLNTKGEIEMTAKNYAKIHKDFKTKIKGTPFAMQIDPKTGGSALFPVTFIKESTDLTEGKNLIPQFQDIVKNKQAKKIGGTMIDMYTASTITHVYDKVSDANKKKMETSNINVLIGLSRKIMGAGQKESVIDEAKSRNPSVGGIGQTPTYKRDKKASAAQPTKSNAREVARRKAIEKHQAKNAAKKEKGYWDESAKGMIAGFSVEIPKQTISGKTIGGGKGGMFVKAKTARQAISMAARRLGVDFKMLKVGKVVKEGVESLDEASNNASLISRYTGTRADAVDDFINTHKLDSEKLLTFVGDKGSLKNRMTFTAAISGKANNRMSRKIVKDFAESVSESVNLEEGQFWGQDKMADKSNSLTGPKTHVKLTRTKGGFQSATVPKKDKKKIAQLQKDGYKIDPTFAKEEIEEGKTGAARLTNRLKKSGVDLDKRAKDRAASHAELKKKYATESAELDEAYQQFLDKTPNWGEDKAISYGRKKGYKEIGVCGHGKIDGIVLFGLDAGDKSYVGKEAKVKTGQTVFRYATSRTVAGDIFPLVKIDVKKGLLYNLSQKSSEGEIEHAEFETKSSKLRYLRLLSTANLRDIVGFDAEVKESVDLDEAISVQDIKKLDGKTVSPLQWHAIRTSKDIKKISMLGKTGSKGSTKHGVIFKDTTSIDIFVESTAPKTLSDIRAER